MRPLREVALERVRRGETTLDEVQRGDRRRDARRSSRKGDHRSARSAIVRSGVAGTDNLQAIAAAPESPPAGDDVTDGRKHVLVVDDEATNRTFARASSRRPGIGSQRRSTAWSRSSAWAPSRTT